MSTSAHPNHAVLGNRPAGKGRGHSNSDERGNSRERAARKTWLLETYAADVTMLEVFYANGTSVPPEPYALRAEHLLAMETVVKVVEHPTCRCYRCGHLLWMGTITVDRIIPRWRGGTYARNNIRPSCNDCAIKTGLVELAKARAAKKKRAK